MADKGIIFSAAMVRALLDGRKTQTRRLLPQPPTDITSAGVYSNSSEGVTDRWTWLSGDPQDCDTWGVGDDFKTGYVPGDRLYVREGYFQFGHWEPVEGKLTKAGRQKWGFIGVPSLVQFDDPPDGYAVAMHRDHPMVPCWHRRLGRFMPRKLSRMWLAVTDVRVQRLQECSDEDAVAEGLTCDERGWWDGGGAGVALKPVDAYKLLWNSLHTADGERWEDNPWVVAVTFEVHQGNIDFATARSNE